MKYIIIILSLLLISCSREPPPEDYNYLENNSVRFIKKGPDTEILINKDNIFYLVILDKKISTTSYDYLINMNTQNNLSINEITFQKKDKLIINLNNINICIYIDKLNKDNYKDCQFIYLYKINKDFYITLNDNIVLIYDSYSKFNYKFMNMLAKVWIDSYTIDDTSYTTITLKEKDYEVTTYKKRGKTIHQKIKS